VGDWQDDVYRYFGAIADYLGTGKLPQFTPGNSPAGNPPAGNSPAGNSPGTGNAPSTGANTPSHQVLAQLLARFRLDGEPQSTPATGTSPQQPTPEPFPNWHLDDKTLASAEEQSYPRRLKASRVLNYKPPPPTTPADPKQWPPEWEMTHEELLARGHKALLMSQWQYFVARGWVIPFVKRLKKEDELVTKVKAARAMLPKIPTGKKQRMQWVTSGTNAGWMYTPDPADPYLKWLYEQWARPWLDSTDAGGVPMLAKMAAMCTMFQEGQPSSINTYDGCVFSYGIGFAIGAPQIVCEMVQDPAIRKVLYLNGIHITPGPKAGASYNTYDIQIVDLLNEEAPLIQVWDSKHHWYGFTDGGKTTVAPSGKGGDKADPYDTFKVDTDNTAIAKKEGTPGDSKIGDGPISNSERPYNAYKHLSNKEGKEMEVIAAFIALAEDELTRAKVNEINQKKITQRATIDGDLCKMYTEAGYTFLSMCVHNWALSTIDPKKKDPKREPKGAQKIWLGELALGPTQQTTPYLSNADSAAVLALRKLLETRPEGGYTKLTYATKMPSNVALVGGGSGKGATLSNEARDTFAKSAPPKNADEWRKLAAVHDAIMAKAIARMVMSLLEWNRWTTGMKKWASDAAKANAAKKAPSPVSMNDEQVRSYNWGWRFKRLREYWLRMSNGHNYYSPLVAVVKGSGINLNETVDSSGTLRWRRADALLQPHGVPYMKFDDGFDISDSKTTATDTDPENFLKVLTSIPNDHYAARRGPEFGDGSGPNIPWDYYDLGHHEYFNLPQIMHQYGRRFELVWAEVDRYGNPTRAKVRLSNTIEEIPVDALGVKHGTFNGPTVEEPDPEWPPEVPAPNWASGMQ
jgi:hypothetical protein